VTLYLALCAAALLAGAILDATFHRLEGRILDFIQERPRLLELFQVMNEAQVFGINKEDHIRFIMRMAVRNSKRSSIQPPDQDRPSTPSRDPESIEDRSVTGVHSDPEDR
jgi:hypothetical protein